jgi:hypothetical protein
MDHRQVKLLKTFKHWILHDKGDSGRLFLQPGDGARKANLSQTDQTAKLEEFTTAK